MFVFSHISSHPLFLCKIEFFFHYFSGSTNLLVGFVLGGTVQDLRPGSGCIRHGDDRDKSISANRPDGPALSENDEMHFQQFWGIWFHSDTRRPMRSAVERGQ